MLFSIGDILNVDGTEYKVVGKITYQNSADNCCWDEYRMFSVAGNREAWLSIDDVYKEYSISFMTRNTYMNGYHQVDAGREVVVSASGNVDVEYGDAAYFIEYEDVTEEKIFSQETWDDGTEYSEGYYLDDNEIYRVSSGQVDRVGFSSSGRNSVGTKKAKVIIAVAIIAAVLLIGGKYLWSLLTPNTIESYLSDESKYEYLTSITGQDNEKADVYQAVSSYSVDVVARDLIDAIDGNTEYVQQDTETDENGQSSIAILTSDEYCIVYTDENAGILVQVSNRKYAYTSDNDLYHGSTRSRSYFRRFYYSTGYSYDTGRYSSSSSAYSDYSGGTIDYSADNTYSSYASSVRQSSVRSRNSSGGGLSAGK